MTEHIDKKRRTMIEISKETKSSINELVEICYSSSVASGLSPKSNAKLRTGRSHS